LPTGTVATLLKLGVAAVLGALVGLEREATRRPAGLRTHILVCMGSTLIMIVSLDLHAVFAGSAAVDPGRIAAQVVSGIGFLGAGTILREGVSVRGLTTAASLWVIAGIGLAVGAGMLIPAAAATVLALATLALLSGVERRLLGGHQITVLTLTIVDVPGQVGRIGAALGASQSNITALSLQPARKAGYVMLEVHVRLGPGLSPAELVERLAQLEGVSAVEM